MSWTKWTENVPQTRQFSTHTKKLKSIEDWMLPLLYYVNPSVLVFWCFKTEVILYHISYPQNWVYSLKDNRHEVWKQSLVSLFRLRCWGDTMFATKSDNLTSHLESQGERFWFTWLIWAYHGTSASVSHTMNQPFKLFCPWALAIVNLGQGSADWGRTQSQISDKAWWLSISDIHYIAILFCMFDISHNEKCSESTKWFLR